MKKPNRAMRGEPKAPKAPRKTLKEKLAESYEVGKNHGWNNAVNRAVTAEHELQKALDRVHILEGDVDHVRKALKPAAKLIEAATNFLGSPAMRYVKEFSVSAGGMNNNSQDTAYVSINIEMMEAQPSERVTMRNIMDSFDYEAAINRKR